MGLSEKTRYLLASDLGKLLDPGTEVSVDQLRKITLLLDQYRRELALSIQQHANEERFTAELLAECEEEVALWRTRLSLARSKKREELIEAADERLTHVRARRDGLKEEHARLVRAIANLKVTKEKVERALHVVRRRTAGQQESVTVGEDTVRTIAASVGLEGGLPGDGVLGEDPLEEAFRALELDEVAGRVQADLEHDGS